MDKEARQVLSERVVRILIADDQAHVRKALQAVLQLEEDFEVVGTAANGVEAVALAEELRPDVILMDLGMPHLDGLEAARRIGHKNLPSLVIALTTPSDPESQQRATQAGAVAVIEKGMPDSALIEVIRSVNRDGSSMSEGEHQ